MADSLCILLLWGLNMDGFIQLAPKDLSTPSGVAQLNIMLQALFDNMPGDGNTVQDLSGYGSPESVVTASIGSTYRRVDGGVDTSIYIKSTGTGNTGWVAIAAPPSLPLSIANGGTGSASGVGGILGAWVAKSSGTIYQAATDGFAVAGNTGGGATNIMLTDSSNPPTTERGRAFGGAAGTVPICCPVRKNDYYEITTSGGSGFYMFFIPLGA